MPLQGCSLADVRSGEHLGDQPVLKAVLQAITEEAIGAAIAEAGAQE